MSTATGRPPTLALVAEEARAQVTAFLRTPVAAFFTLAFPLLVLLLVGSLVGNEVLESRSGVRLAQFFTPAIAAYAAATAAYTSLAIGLSLDRERGVLRRLRALPIPTVALLGGRVASGAVTGLCAVVVMVMAGVLVLDVQVVWPKLPAVVVTLLLGTGCFAALGFAVSGLVRTVDATQAVTNATLVPLAFVSDVFVLTDDMPRALEVVAGIFPLRAFAHALGAGFDPFAPGAGVAWSHLAMLLVWGVAGVVVAGRTWTWEPARPARPASSGAPGGVAGGPGVGRRAEPPPTLAAGRVQQVGRPSWWSLAAAQVADGVTAVVRTPTSAFFTLAFPVVMLLLFTAVFGEPELDARGGARLPQHLAPALGIFGMATVTFVELAERLAAQRDRGVLTRVRSTPLPLGAFMAGRVGSAVLLGTVSLTLVLVVGALALDVEVPHDRVPVALLVVTAGITCFTLLGLALVALAPRAEAVSPMANAILLPMAFVSDVFLIGDLPGWLTAAADALPLRPAVVGLSDVLNPALGPGVPWARLGVLVAWAVLGALVVRWRFDFSPRR